MERPLRIALISEHASPLTLLGGADAGGQNVYIDEVSRHLAANGHQVDVFTRREHPDQQEVVSVSPGVRVIHIAAGPAACMPKDELWPLMPAFRDAFVRFARRQPAPFDVVHGNFWMSGWVAVEAQRLLQIPAVQLFHALGVTKRRHQGECDSSPAERIHIEREVVARADRVIAQCPHERAELVNDYGADPHSVTLLPAGVNTNRFQPVSQDEARQRIRVPTDELVVAYVGRMLPRKDVRNVVRGFASLLRSGIRARLLLVGGETADADPVATPEIGVLQQMVAEEGIAGQVHFTGKRQPDVLRDYYGAADLVVTTPWYEPFGLTPLEAMACARPVIGAAVGGIPFTVQDGVTGLLVPPRDHEALADALRTLLLDRTRREAMGRAARFRVEREFTWETVAERLAALYHTVIDERSLHTLPAKIALNVR